MKPRILIDDKIPFIKGALEPVADVKYLSGNNFSKELVKDADALIIRTRTKCTKELLTDSKVKYIATATIGFDHIDRDFCDTNNITWSNCPGCNAGSVQQYLASALIHLEETLNLKLDNLTLGVVGVGNVGTKAVKLANTFGMKVLKNDPPVKDRLEKEGKLNQAREYVSYDEIIEKADIITYHVPYTTTGNHPTHYLLNKDILKSLAEREKPATVINTSRGEVFDNKSLRNHLIRNPHTTAILDVWENEPEIDTELMKLTTLATPHIAGYSADGKANGTMRSVRKISKFFNLNLDNWQPEIPSPVEERFRYESKEDQLTLLKELMKHTYKIKDDDDSLRSDVKKFEFLRGNYQTRREILAHLGKSSILINDKEKLEGLISEKLI